MKIEEISRVADGAFKLLHAAEKAEQLLDAKIADGLVCDALRALLLRVLPLYTMAELEQLALEAALRASGSKAGAAKSLGIARRTVYARLEKEGPAPSH